jgi:hypothetical protein
MRRHREQLQEVATVGVEGSFSLTAPQWQEPWCMEGLSKGAGNRGIGDCLIGDDPQSQAHRVSFSERKMSAFAASYHRPSGDGSAVFRTRPSVSAVRESINFLVTRPGQRLLPVALNRDCRPVADIQPTEASGLSAAVAVGRREQLTSRCRAHSGQSGPRARAILA